MPYKLSYDDDGDDGYYLSMQTSWGTCWWWVFKLAGMRAHSCVVWTAQCHQPEKPYQQPEVRRGGKQTWSGRDEEC